MRPFKTATGLAMWLLRFSLIAGIYKTSFNTFTSFAFNSLNYFIHLFLIVFGVMLFVGAFVSKHSTTVLSALFLFILYVILLFVNINSGISTIITYATLMSLSLFFLANGNK